MAGVMGMNRDRVIGCEAGCELRGCKFWEVRLNAMGCRAIHDLGAHALQPHDDQI